MLLDIMTSAVAEAPAPTPIETSRPAMHTGEPMTANVTSVTPWEADAPSEAPAETPEEQPGEPAPQPAQEAETPPPVAERPKWSPQDVPDEEIERWVKEDPRLRERIEQLGANRAGNQLQKERERIRQELRAELQREEESWTQAQQSWKELEEIRESDPDRYIELLRNDDRVHTFVKQFPEMARQREAQRNAPPAPDIEAIKVEVGTAWNNVAIEEFQGAAKVLVAEYDSLPEASRKVIEGAKFDPSGNWFADSLKALVEGVNSRWENRLKKEVEEARQAGRNSALAEREEDAPLVTGAKLPAESEDALIRRHSEGEELTEDEQRRLHAIYRKRGWN